MTGTTPRRAALDLDLDALEARAAAATEGPWTSDNFEIYPSEGGPDVSCENGCDGGCDDDERAPIQCARVSHATEVIADVYGLQQFADQDGAFIAHARTDVPALVSALRAARAENAELRGLLAEVKPRIAAPRPPETIADMPRNESDWRALHALYDRIDAALKETK